LKFVRIDGRIRLVNAEVGRSAGHVDVEIVAGSREVKGVAGKAPGPGWRKDPSRPRGWIKTTSVVEVVTVLASQIFESEDWPSGLRRNKFTVDELAEAVKSVVERGTHASGSLGKRQAPCLTLNSVEAQIKGAGLAMPTEEELKEAVELAWSGGRAPALKRKPTQVAAKGREIIPEQPPVEQPPVEQPPVEQPPVEQPPVEQPPVEQPPVEQPFPAGTVGFAGVPEGCFWSSALKCVLPNNDEGVLMHSAALKGWPAESMVDAKKTVKGAFGYNLTFMAKTQFDMKKHQKKA
jgi:hypothetical protein